MKKLASALAALALSSSAVFAQTAPAAPMAPSMSTSAPEMMTSLPAQSVTVTDWYRQAVYDPANNKIGEVADVLVGSDGKISALIIGVGGFLGMGEKDVAIPFSSVQHTMQDSKTRLILNTSKDALRSANGFRYDSTTTTWQPAAQ